MKDYQASIEKLRRDATEAALIRDLATDPAKRDMFDRLHEHLNRLANEVEQAMKSITVDTIRFNGAVSAIAFRNPYQFLVLRLSAPPRHFRSNVAAGRFPAFAHLLQRRRLARSCTKVVGGCFMAARSTSLGVLQREHWISSQGKPPLIAQIDDSAADRPAPYRTTFARSTISQSNRSACCNAWVSLGPHLGQAARRGCWRSSHTCLPSSWFRAFAVAAGQGRRMILRGHPASKRVKRIGSPDGPKGRSNRRRRTVRRHCPC